MDPEILRAAKKIGKERGVPVEVKSKGNSHYLYRDTTRWDKERKKRVKVSEYIGRIRPEGDIRTLQVTGRGGGRIRFHEERAGERQIVSAHN